MHGCSKSIGRWFATTASEILEGRKPFAVRDAHESSGAVTFEEIIARKWAKDCASGGKASDEATAGRYRVAEERLRRAVSTV